MTIKPERTKYERPKDEERIRFRRRSQEEQEAKRSLNDFLKHFKEDEDDGYASRPLQDYP